MDLKLANCNNKKTMIIWLTKSDCQDSTLLRRIEDIKSICEACVYYSGGEYSCEETVKGIISNHIIS